MKVVIVFFQEEHDGGTTNFVDVYDSLSAAERSLIKEGYVQDAYSKEIFRLPHLFFPDRSVSVAEISGWMEIKK